MKQTFVEKRFNTESREIIDRANTIIESYQVQGYQMTLRQVYYQFVTKNWLVNTERSYKRLGSILNDARYAGLIDWDAIEDRNRVPSRPGEFSDLGSLARAALGSYRLNRWKGQPYYAELWVEKAALAGVLEPLANEWHATLMVNRGYSSASAMYQAAQRFQDRRGQEGIVFYLGDHDPSGEDMVRDIQERFETFLVPVQVRKIALTMAQVQEYQPPPNPAKTTDSRYGKYAAEHGEESWEVDALPPDVLGRLIREAFVEIVDRDAIGEVLEKERTDKAAFSKALKTATKGEHSLPDYLLEVETPFKDEVSPE